jgi:very-short-patch-repair endonuclease
VDFFCAEKGLAIELDGQHHRDEEAQFAYDDQRTQYLVGNGLSVLRFRNDEVLADIDAVCDAIVAKSRRLAGWPEKEVPSPMNRISK